MDFDSHEDRGELARTNQHDISRTQVATTVQQEIQSAMVVAQKCPRNEDASRQNLLTCAKRRKFADECTYEYPRGKKQLPSGEWVQNYVTGPSVKMAREFARIWGHMRSGIRIVADDDDTRSIVGWAWDLQSNTYEESPDTFKKLIQRKVGNETKWVTPDERDLRELTNRRGAICVRNCVLHLMPSWLTDEVIEEASKTMQQEDSRDPEAAKRQVIDAFAGLHIPVDELKDFIGHDLGSCSPAELQKLRGVYKSISTGEMAWVDFYQKSTQSVHAAAEASAAFGGATAESTERPGDDAKRPCLPTHLRQRRDDDRPVSTYLLDTIPTLNGQDLDYVANALPGLRLEKQAIQLIIQALANRRTQLDDAGGQQNEESGTTEPVAEKKEPLPEVPEVPQEIANVLHRIQVCRSTLSLEAEEMGINMFKANNPQLEQWFKKIDDVLSAKKERLSADK